MRIIRKLFFKVAVIFRDLICVRKLNICSLLSRRQIFNYQCLILLFNFLCYYHILCSYFHYNHLNVIQSLLSSNVQHSHFIWRLRLLFIYTFFLLPLSYAHLINVTLSNSHNNSNFPFQLKDFSNQYNARLNLTNVY